MAGHTILDMPGYTLTHMVFEGAATTVYRGRRDADGVPIAVKVTRGAYPTGRELARLRREFGIQQQVAHLPGVVHAHGLEKCGRGLALVMEDLGASSLRDLIDARTLELGAVLRLAASIAQTLASLHEAGIIHKDIKPHNILIDEATQAPRLVDFGISARLAQETQKAVSAAELEGTLAYMAPEQTGRMNRVVDLRADLYSLGVTLYEMLVGALPFAAQDATEMIHCHIARMPLPPHERALHIPQALSDVVMKLLAKTPEDRYQSARGVKWDLDECLRQWTATGQILPFALGRQDRAGALRIPQKLYGRDRDVAALLSAFERARAPGQRAAELLVVAGSSGMGKSALVNEIHKPIAQRGGHFVSGKFDQIGRDVPLAPVVHAFRELIQQILREPASTLEGWKQRLVEAVGVNGRILCELIPELEIVIGPQPEVPALGPDEAKNRFGLLVQRFVRVFARAGHPLCIFLDDLQWADSASLRLLRLLIEDPESPNLLVIGAYRDNEVDAGHLLSTTLDELRKTGALTTEIKLAPLDLATTTELLADTLSAPASEVEPLADLVFDKTQGNPFFVGQLLRTLHEEGIVRLETTSGAFSWDAERARGMAVTDNVVELMVSRLQRFSPDTQRVLRLAACIGYAFDLSMLATVDQRPAAEVAAVLWEALREGLVVPLDGDYRLLDTGASADEEQSEELRVSYRFLHDRVHQAAYSLIEEEHRASLHLSIGRLLWARNGETPRDEDLATIVGHLNLGSRGIAGEGERAALAGLNLRAGRRAKSATAYQAADGYFSTGRELLGERGWERDYEVCAALHVEGAECASLSGAPERADALFNTLLPRVRTDMERVRTHRLRVLLYTMLGRFVEAIEAGRAGLALLGICLPQGAEATQAAIGAESLESTENLGGRRVEDLLDAKTMDDPERTIALHMLGDLVMPTYHTDPSLGLLSTLKQVNLSLKHGHTDMSATAYVTYGFYLLFLLGKPAEGNAFLRLALALQERRPITSSAGSLVYCLFATSPWETEPLRTLIPYFHKGRQAGLESGDFIWAANNCQQSFFLKLGAGYRLEELREDIDKDLPLLQRLGNPVATQSVILGKQLIANLEGRTRDRGTLSDEGFDEEAFYVTFGADVHSVVGLCYRWFVIMLRYLHGDYARAAELAAQPLTAGTGVYGLTQIHFYTCITLAALPAAATPEQAAQRRADITRYRDRMVELAAHCPKNYEHQRLLLDAEVARLDGRTDEAFALYDQAIARAAEDEFPHHEALANELAAKLYIHLGRPKLARGYILDAYSGYLHWGATAKAEDIARDHAALLPAIAVRARGATSRSVSSVSSTSTHSFTLTQTTMGSLRDAALVVRATQAITGETALPKLIERLARIVLENAGAQRGALLLSRGGQLFVEATFGVDPERIEVGPSAPLDGHRGLAESVALLVARTREPLVLDDAGTDPRFSADPHVQSRRARSILCLPLVHQTRLGGLLYLEHQDTVAAFGAARVELLSLFASQAAIAIENAFLIADIQAANEDVRRANERLGAEVAQRTEELRQSNRELIETNERLGIEVAQRTEELRQSNCELIETNERLQIELTERARAERERGALQEQMIEAQRSRLLELSTPLIPITDRIVVMPLIGTVDAERAAQVLEAALNGAQRHTARVVILDITGMRHIDTGVVSTLLRTASALRLLGAQAVLTGIRAEVAQAMVALDVEMSALVTLGTLQSGIAYALHLSGESGRPTSRAPARA